MFRNSIAQERQNRKLVEIHNTDKILIFQNFQRFLFAASGKGIENTVGHQLPETDTKVIFIQSFQKSVCHLIFQTIHRFFQIFSGQLLCQFHQRSIHAVRLRQSISICQMVEDHLLVFRIINAP